LIEKPPVAGVLCRDAAVTVEGLAAFGEESDQLVDDHVAWAGVEGDDLFGLCVFRERRDVGDAADIEGNAGFRGAAEQEVIDERNERGALAAGGDIPG